MGVERARAALREKIHRERCVWPSATMSESPWPLSFTMTASSFAKTAATRFEERSAHVVPRLAKFGDSRLGFLQAWVKTGLEARDNRECSTMESANRGLSSDAVRRMRRGRWRDANSLSLGACRETTHASALDDRRPRSTNRQESSASLSLSLDGVSRGRGAQPRGSSRRRV